MTRFVVTHRVGFDLYRVEFTHDTRNQALQMLGRWAGNPDLSLSWYECAVMCQRISKMLSDYPVDPIDELGERCKWM